MEESKKKSKNNLIKIILIVILLILIIFLIYFRKAKNNLGTNVSEVNNKQSFETTEFDYVKKYSDKDFVFVKEYVTYKTYDESEDSFETRFELPVINLKFKEIEKINSKLEDFYNRNKSYCEDYSDICYPWIYIEKQLTNGILDITITYANDSGEQNTFKENYHIDIKNENIISNQEFFSKLEIDEKLLEELINDSFMERYLTETSQKVFCEKFKNFDDFKNSIKYIDAKNEVIAEKYKYDFKKICENSVIHYVTDKQISINNIATPTFFGTDAGEVYSDSEYYYCDGITINLEKTYVFSKYCNYYCSNEILKENSYITNKVPIINLKSNDADKVNAELSKFFDNLEKTIEKNGGDIILAPLEEVNENGQKIILQDEVIFNKNREVVINEYYAMNFAYTIINDKVLAIIVEEAKNKFSLGPQYHKILIYNFNIETGKLLTNEEFIELCGVKIEDFKKGLEDKLKLVSNKEVKYNINDLEITFEDKGKLFYATEYKANMNGGYIKEPFEKFVVLGKNFPNYPYTWVEVFLDLNKDLGAAELKNKQTALDVTYINNLIENYNGTDKHIIKKISDLNDAQYYLFDFENNGEMECVIVYDFKLYMYRKSEQKVTTINDFRENRTIYEVKNKLTGENELFIKTYNSNGICFEDMSLKTIKIEDNKIVIRPIIGYSCDTEKENKLREEINNNSKMDVTQKEEAIKDAHSLQYYRNNNYYLRADTSLDIDIIIVNDSVSLQKEIYDVYVEDYKNQYELVFSFE